MSSGSGPRTRSAAAAAAATRTAAEAKPAAGDDVAYWLGVAKKVETGAGDDATEKRLLAKALDALRDDVKALDETRWLHEDMPRERDDASVGL